MLSWYDGHRRRVLAPGDRCWVKDGNDLRRLAWLASPYPELSWQGQPAAAVAPHTWRRWVVWVGAEPELLGMDARQAIAYPLQLRGVAPAEIERRTERWAERLGLPAAVWGTSPLALSQEQQKQIAWVRALALEPPVLLGDRPCRYLSPPACQRLVQAWTALPQTIGVIHDDPAGWPGWQPLSTEAIADDV